MDFCERFGVWDWMCSTQSDSPPPPPQQRPTLMSCVCTPSADDGAGPLCKMSPPESAATAPSASTPDSSSAVPDPAPSSPVFVLLALTETEEECHSLPPSAVRSASSSAASSSSSSSSSSDSAIASSSLLSSPTQNGVVARAASPSLCTSSSTGASVLHVAHQSVDGGTWEPVGPVQHLRMDLHNAMDQLQKMASLVAHRAVLFCSREAIRQSIYPLCANAMLAQLAAEEAERCGELRQDVQLFSARLPLPSLFHAFVPFSSPCNVPPPSNVPSSESATEVDGAGGEETPTEPMECGGAELRRQLEERIRRMGAKLRERGESAVAILSRLDRVAQGYTPAVCSEMHVDSRCVVRARGLPWHVSDLDVALFFAGLDIPPGGIALCLGPEGRRSGEALVRFARADQRELALQRHRRHLHARYIEVYRASGDEFVKHAVGTDSQAVRFALRAETAMAMIVRMRGLPFTATEQQVRDFFSSDGQPSGLLDQPGSVLFVHRPDGRPSGDAFVLFGDEQSGRRALAKHRQRMGGRYIELFRTTQAEVQQLFNARAIAQQNAAIAAAMNKLGAVVPLTTVQQSVLAPASPTTVPAALSGTAAAAALPAQQRVPQQRQRDCLRLRGLPYEAQVQQVVEFLGPHARQVLFQGVHMIYNSAGHPSGEAFIQMESEQAAAQAALEMHNKYMELGKKRRYIEVFQCCSEDMSLLLNVLPPPSPVNGLLPPPPLTPTGGPPALASLFSFPMPTPLNPLGAGGGAPSPSPLLAAFPVPPQFLAFPSPAGVSNGDPSMGGGVLVAVSGQFAGPLVQQLYAAPPPPDAATAAQFAHHSAVPAEFWLRNMAALRNGAAAAIATTAAAPFAAPTPLLPFHHHQLHSLPAFTNGAPPAHISFAAAPTEVVAVQQPT